MSRSLQEFATLVLLLGGFTALHSQNVRTPEQTVQPIVERVIRETSFALRVIPQRPVLDIEVVDFAELSGSAEGGIAFAASRVWSPSDTTVCFGLSYDLPLTIRLNNAVVFSDTTPPPFLFHEIGYGVFRFNDTVRLSLRKGVNQILMKARLSGERNVCYLRQMTEPDGKPSCKFQPPGVNLGRGAGSWRYCGVFGVGALTPMNAKLPPEDGWQKAYVFRGRHFAWKPPSEHLLKELRIDPNAVYRRESYAEWQYPTGTLMLSLLAFADADHDSIAAGFVRKYCSFTLDNVGLFRTQYRKMHAFRGLNHRMLRRGMLDDAGAPTLPFAELRMRASDVRFDSLIGDMTRYVAKEQLRLPDGTFCRPEPVPGTVWADDLFMSAPLLTRIGIIKHDTAYVDDAASQVLNFRRYLEDSTTGLYRHAWFNARKQRSPIPWGRANGWIVWATSEVLTYLPMTHPMRNAIATAYRNHLEALIRYQAPSGLWHQVLDRPDSFEETSCSAMFIIGLARGLRWGILDDRFRQPLQRAWSGLRSRISEDGVVRDICRGTGIGDTYEFYAGRERFDNDPRGLGAVITACVEMMRMEHANDTPRQR